mmetsp:Transcript_55146/g.129107  ORF Transcript_55146/g.129107 Transcript_55146/m.129107 type:complete len:338 (-) Transcript_55146:12-1025(-)|eukprot:4473635-Amphidinium_carterae.1
MEVVRPPSAPNRSEVNGARRPRASSARQHRRVTEDLDGFKGIEIKEVAAKDHGLLRRNNRILLQDVEDAMRIFDAVDEADWDQRYRFYSNAHMRKSYQAHAKARHDPFNKDPAWGLAILRNVHDYCEKTHVSLDNIFKQMDITGDGNLNRVELKRMLLTAKPNMSDLEINAIFDTVDNDHSDLINFDEFHAAIQQTLDVEGDLQERARRWRNPIHRSKRNPPAIIDGWAHLQDIPIQCEREHAAAREAQASLMHRLAVGLTPRSQIPTCKYQYFGGGGHAARFRRDELRKMRKAGTPEPKTGSWLPDPGPFAAHIGWHAELAAAQRARTPNGAATAR